MAEIAPQVRSNVDVLTRELDTIAHNLANASTPGFKRRCNAFSAALQSKQALKEDLTPSPVEIRASLDFTQGHLVKTGRDLDVAISGKGFFAVETPDGPLYTRNGIFHTNATGQLVDSDGRLVSGATGPIVLPPNGLAVHINSEGTIYSGPTPVGKLRVVDFQDNEKALIPAGDTAYRAPAGVTPAAASATVQQGFQEASNVQMVEELVGMMSISRLYEASMRFISARREASQAMMDVAMG